MLSPCLDLARLVDDFVGAFVGEVISSNAGLGHLIVVAEGLFNVNQIWASVLGFMIIALIMKILLKPLTTLADKYTQNIGK